MSMPFYGITCTSCDFKDNYDYGTNYFYEGSEEKAPFLIVAYCATCDRIVTACRAFTVADAAPEIDDIQNSINRNRSGIFWRFSKYRKKMTTEYECELALTRASTSARAEYFEHYPFKERCIDCGGHSIQGCTFPSDEPDQPMAMGVKHICGGNLLVQKRGRMSFASISRVIYGEGGTILRREVVSEVG